MTDPVSPTPLRQLTSSDAPYPGHLISGDPPLVWTDARLWQDGTAWRADPDGHVLAPVDAGTRAGSMGVLVPHCPHRLGDLLGGRAGLTDGEIVTVAVSLLRGGADADRLGIEHGRWWVTTEGRPVLAAVGERPWRADLPALFGTLRRECTPGMLPALDAACDILADPIRLRRERDGAEEGLFAVAAALPLAVEPAAARVRVPPDPREDEAIREAVARTRRAGEERPGVLHGALRGVLDADVLARVREAGRGVAGALRRRRSGGRRGGRRVPLLVGGAVGAAVLAVGLLWPDDRQEPAAGVTPGVTPAAPKTDSGAVRPPGAQASEVPASEVGEPSSRDADGDDAAVLSATGAALLDRLAACAALGCPGDVVEDAARPIPPGAASETGADRTVSLVDDYGGVAVLRVEAAGSDPQLAVIVRTNDSWLVRDVYDVGASHESSGSDAEL